MKESIKIINEINYEVGEFRWKVKKLYEAKNDLKNWVGKPKYEMMKNILIPKLTEEISEHFRLIKYFNALLNNIELNYDEENWFGD